MINKLRLFKKYKFFSLNVLLSDLIKLVINFLSIRTIKIKNKKIKFYSASEITFIRAALFGKKEREVYKFIDKYLKSDHIFFDIGANIGVFSIYSSLIKNVKCIAFEPEYSNIFLLKKNIDLNNLSNLITTYPLALGNSTSLSQLHLSSMESGSALHTVSNESLKFTDENALVKSKIGSFSIKLDDFVKQTNIFPDMMKIDTDGAELDILLGSKETLNKVSFIALELPINEEKKQNCLRILDEFKFVEDRNLRVDRNLFFYKL